MTSMTKELAFCSTGRGDSSLQAFFTSIDFIHDYEATVHESSSRSFVQNTPLFRSEFMFYFTPHTDLFT